MNAETIFENHNALEGIVSGSFGAAESWRSCWNQFLMTNPSPHEVTHLLAEWGGGDESALGELIPLVERELRRLATTT